MNVMGYYNFKVALAVNFVFFSQLQNLCAWEINNIGVFSSGKRDCDLKFIIAKCVLNGRLIYLYLMQ